MSLPTYHAVPTYMGPGWSLHMSTPDRPKHFRTVPRDFIAREDAEDYAREHADEHGATVQFHSSTLDVIDPK